MNGPTPSETLKEKQENLSKLKRHLKVKFVGLDDIIDKLCVKIASWYLFPSMQTRPVVINLWGLTGTGKSALVKELVHFLGLENHFIQYDFSSNSHHHRFKADLKDKLIGKQDQPFVLCFDEIQHLRSKNEAGMEKSSQHELWNLLDKGHIMVSGDYDDYSNVYQAYLALLLTKKYPNIRVEKGMVVKGKELFRKCVDRYISVGREDSSADPEYFIDPSDYRYIETLDSEVEDLQELSDKILSFNKEQSLQYLKGLLKLGVKPETIECKTGLVFIIGNIDEAYPMADELDSSVDADTLHERTLNLTATDIRSALARRFRPEQIARLGNNHLWYPAFNKEQYLRLIQLKIDKLRQDIKLLWHIDVEVDPGVIDLIYLEGVIPSQGTRPVFSTIQAILESPLKEALADIKIQEEHAEKVKVFIYPEQEEIGFKTFKDHRVTREIKKPVVLEEFNRMNNRSFCNLESILAVHESGHSLAAVLYIGVLPKKISIVNRGNSRAFARIENKREFETKETISNRLRILLAGQAAERLIFGAKKMANGSSEDLRRATALALEHLTKNGWGSKIGFYDKEGVPFPCFTDKGLELQKEAENWVQTCAEQVQLHLSQHKQELALLSQAVFKKGVLSTDDILIIRGINWPELKLKYATNDNHLDLLKSLYPKAEPERAPKLKELRTQQEEDQLLSHG